MDLFNMVQQCTGCSTSYCLRRKSNETELKCRFHFPFDICPKTKLEFEKIHTSGNNEHYRAKIVTKQNVIDHYACVEYIKICTAKGGTTITYFKTSI